MSQQANLGLLMTNLRSTHPHFVRCLIPNESKTPGKHYYYYYYIIIWFPTSQRLQVNTENKDLNNDCEVVIECNFGQCVTILS